MSRPVHICPNCHTRIPTSRTRGRPKTAYLEAEGKRLHADDWAAEMEVSITTIRNWTRHPLGFARMVKLHRRDA